MYFLCGSIVDAKNIFYQLDLQYTLPWNWMIRGFTMMGYFEFALLFYFKMLGSGISPDKYTFPSVIKACGGVNNVRLGKAIYDTIQFMGFGVDIFVGSSLIQLYMGNGCIHDAWCLFVEMPHKDCVLWNVMLHGYVKNGESKNAVGMFLEMRNSEIKPNAVTFACILSVCASEAMIGFGTQLHGLIVACGLELDSPVANTLLAMNVDMAHKIFNQSTRTDVVMCTAMISGLVLNGMNNDALEIFRWLLKEKMRPNSLTLASVLPACAGLVALKLGKELHGNILKHGLDGRLHLGSALTDMYAKSGRLDLVHQVFERMFERDTICWNSMITSYSQNGKPEEAIDIFRQMGMAGAKYDCVSISAALSACANLPALHYGKEIHGFMIRSAFRSDLFAESALIDVYAKCGNLFLARSVFDMMEEKNEVSWNSIISAYGSHGCLQDSLVLFHEMLGNGILLDHVTFLGILSACGHAGQVDDGIFYFRCMIEEYGIPARLEHCACMVDLFGRAGRLSEAFETIKSMPFSPDSGVWGTLLGACRVHGNVELAEEASRHLFDLEPQNSGYYILLSNIHADAGKWGSVLKVRSLMKERGVQKVPGYSWIEVNNNTHMFVAADGSHPQSAQIYSMLKSLLLELRKEGYNPQPCLPTHPQTSGM
ncbi:PREDICTED: pentatricopeptide repeat-containing protein At4g21300-like [Prunus mume]|uniref:Pentatricopeptide repeat-containing protein At4g21300-like n=1 Tax=Prunus mume TaxID=102107 RepID=A0ABM1LNG7_PRUMU|nr:PREDICTED: pentatricopeptide repeat-containing protein At4g21300-like [Prunus mume]